MIASPLRSWLQRFQNHGRVLSPRIILVAGLLVMVSGTVIIRNMILLPGFARVEHSDTVAHATRARDALAQRITALADATGDWSNWTDTYEFINTADPQFVEDNLASPTTFVQLKLDGMMFVHRSGRRVVTRVYDPAKDAYVPPPQSVLELTTKSRVLLQHYRTDSQVAGIVRLPERILLVGSKPILTSESTGPIRGAVIFFRYLDNELVRELAEQVHLQVSMEPVAGKALPADFGVASKVLADGTPVAVQVLDSEYVAGYTMMRDVYGRPALVLRVRVPRTIFAQGRKTTGEFLLLINGVGLLLGLILTSVAERLGRSQIARRRMERRYRAVVEQTSDGMLLLDDGLARILDANDASRVMLGMGDVDPRQQSLLEISPPLHQLIHALIRGTEAARTKDLVWRRPDGEKLDLEVSADRITSNGESSVVVALRDVTEHRAAERALRTSEERYALTAQGANDALWDWNLQTNYMYFGPRWKDMLGLADEELAPKLEAWMDRTHPDDRPHLAQALARHVEGHSPHFECEFRLLHTEGTYRWMLARGLAVRDEAGVVVRFAGSMTDITDRKLAEERLAHDALHDSLTALPNRALFADRLTQALARTHRLPESKFAVLFLDLDRFKVVNDSIGHLAGDNLLVQVGKRVTALLRAEDTFARLGGDEFAILLESISNPAALSMIVNRIHGALKSAFDLDGRQVFITVSIGSVVSSEEHRTPHDLLRDADTALYKAKSLGRDRHITFDPGMREQAMVLLQLESDLRRAVEQGELVLHYQPVISFASRAICGFEALVRWQHPRRGLLSPGMFISLAEEIGLIVPIGRWVLQEACGQIRTLAHQFPSDPPLWVSVNVAAKQFAQTTLVDEIADLIKTHTIAARTLKIEITETAVMEDLSRATTTIRQLQALGTQVALDDFGTGYSSLGTLRHLPIDIVKIDRSFISAIDDNNADPAIVSTIASLAHGLGMAVVAEGVETGMQAAHLSALGCEYGQGYVFSKPLSAAQVADLLAVGPRYSVPPLVDRGESRPPGRAATEPAPASAALGLR